MGVVDERHGAVLTVPFDQQPPGRPTKNGHVRKVDEEIGVPGRAECADWRVRSQTGSSWFEGVAWDGGGRGLDRIGGMLPLFAPGQATLGNRR